MDETCFVQVWRRTGPRVEFGVPAGDFVDAANSLAGRAYRPFLESFGTDPAATRPATWP